MLRSNPSAASGGCTAVEAVSILRGSGRPLILPVAQKAKNLGVWGRAPEAAESGNTFLFRHLKSLIVAEPRQFLKIEMDCSEQNYLSGIKEVKRH